MKNQIKTILLLIVLTAFLMFIGGLIGGRQGVIIAFILSLAMNFITYWKSDKIVLSMYKATPVDEHQAPELYDMVRGLAQKAQMPMPRVYIIPEEVPNAFATGRNPENAVVAVTQGLLRTMNSDELRAVVAHEMGHIKNRDILISTIAATLAGAVMFLANMARYGAIFGGGDGNHRGGGNVLILILVSILAPLAAMVVQMSISRSREYQADATGAQISGTPNSLANALQKLENYSKRTEPIDTNPATAHMFTVNPLAGGGLKTLFSTHPPIQERISRLRNTRVQYRDDASTSSPVQVADLYPKRVPDEAASIEEDKVASSSEEKPLTPAEEAAQAAWRRLSGK